MSDLAIGGILIVALAAGLFVAVVRTTRALPQRTLNLLAVLIVASLALYVELVWFDVRLAHWLPVSSLIVVGNWLPLFAAALAAVAWRSSAGSRPRQVFLAGTLLAT